MVIKELKIKQGEYWYGGAVNDGYVFPLSENDEYSVDLTKNDTYNQINPLYVSSFGRYIWLEKAGKISFEKGIIRMEAEEVEIDESSKTLKQAQQAAARKHFPANGKTPSKTAFSAPQICSWIALDYSQNQNGILSYAENYVKSGYKPGIIILDDTWQRDYGVWEFDAKNFPEPKKMTDRLHELGFKIVLWLVPYLSPDSASFRELKEKDAFLLGENGKPLLSNWWNGYSFVLDFSKKDAKEWFDAQVARLKRDYGIDGFKLDGGDAQFLDGGLFPQANEQNKLWANAVDLNENDAIVELRACYKMGGTNVISRLADKAHSWGVEWIKNADLPGNGYLKYGLSTLVPNILTQGLTGYYYACPDMVGGGLWLDFAGKKLDHELLIRSCQCSAFMPMIQFSHPLWEMEDELVKNAMNTCLSLREQIVPYILFLAENAAKTNEPIVRYMEYEYPQQGLEKTLGQFMIGDRYIAAPITEKRQTQKTVYFPKNTAWKNVVDGKTYGAGARTFDVDINTILIFEKI